VIAKNLLDAPARNKVVVQRQRRTGAPLVLRFRLAPDLLLFCFRA
jgi:hypothetical protein